MILTCSWIGIGPGSSDLPYTRHQQSCERWEVVDLVLTGCMGFCLRVYDQDPMLVPLTWKPNNSILYTFGLFSSNFYLLVLKKTLIYQHLPVQSFILFNIHIIQSQKSAHLVTSRRHGAHALEHLFGTCGSTTRSQWDVPKEWCENKQIQTSSSSLDANEKENYATSYFASRVFCSVSVGSEPEFIGFNSVSRWSANHDWKWLDLLNISIPKHGTTSRLARFFPVPSTFLDRLRSGSNVSLNF